MQFYRSLINTIILKQLSERIIYHCVFTRWINAWLTNLPWSGVIFIQWFCLRSSTELIASVMARTQLMLMLALVNLGILTASFPLTIGQTLDVLLSTILAVQPPCNNITAMITENVKRNNTTPKRSRGREAKAMFRAPNLNSCPQGHKKDGTGVCRPVYGRWGKITLFCLFVHTRERGYSKKLLPSSFFLSLFK